MARAKVSKRQKAFRLFGQGFLPASPEIKNLNLTKGTRYTYFYEWEKAGRPIYSASGVKTQTSAKVPLLGGESVAAIIEPLTEELNPEEEPESEEEETGEEGEKPGDDGKKIPIPTVTGEALRVTIDISVKTMALYQLAASMQTDGGLTLGDFVDVCVEDTYRGRGVDLGLVPVGG